MAVGIAHVRALENRFFEAIDTNLLTESVVTGDLNFRVGTIAPLLLAESVRLCAS